MCGVLVYIVCVIWIFWVGIDCKSWFGIDCNFEGFGLGVRIVVWGEMFV